MAHQADLDHAETEEVSSRNPRRQEEPHPQATIPVITAGMQVTHLPPTPKVLKVKAAADQADHHAVDVAEGVAKGTPLCKDNIR